MESVFHSLGHAVLPFVALLSVIIVIHELGHYAAARLLRLPISRFSLGFGPPLLRRTDRHGTEWRLSAVPLGGYVRVAFDGQPMARAVVVAAGPLANVGLAVALLFAGQLTTGVHDAPPVIAAVQAHSPAESAGLRPGDRILAIDGRTVTGFSEVVGYIALHLDESVAVSLERDGAHHVAILHPEIRTVTLAGGRVERVGVSGMLPGPAQALRPGVGAALDGALRQTRHLLSDTMHGLSQLISGARSHTSLVGVVGLADMTGTLVEHSGLAALLGFAALVSLNIAMVNAMPLPVLDGGQLLFALAEALFRRPLPGPVIGYANALGLGVLSAVLLLTTWNDIAILL